MSKTGLKKKIKTKVIISNLISYILLIAISIICAGPFIWLLLSSLRTGANIYDLHFSLSSFSFANYTGVMEFMKLHKYVWNTVVITFGAIAIDVVFSAMCAYPLATALQYLNGSFSYKFGYVAAGTILSIIPVLIVFMLCQKNYIEAVSGAVKG